jgi:hypothetical protein
MQAMSGMFQNPQFMQMAEKLGQAIIQVCTGCCVHIEDVCSLSVAYPCRNMIDAGMCLVEVQLWTIGRRSAQHRVIVSLLLIDTCCALTAVVACRATPTCSA